MPQGLLRFIKYSAVGFSTFALDLLLLFVLVEVFSVRQVPAAGIAFIIAVSLNYMLSRRYVFIGTLRGVKAGYLGFTAIALAGLSIVAGGMYVLTVILNVHFLIARIMVAVVTGFCNYLINLYVNFKVAGHHEGEVNLR
jgi:putative flippase GtrA